MSDDGNSPGPIESTTWPEHLTSRAVDGTRLFGYDVQEDLARHYRLSDVLFLALTGELPDDACGRAFETALVFASTMSAGKAPIHATMLARLCGARSGGIFSIAALSLGEDAESLVARVSEVLAGIEALEGNGVLPDDLRAIDDEDRRSVARLREHVEDLVVAPMLEKDPSLDAALVAVFHACGVHEPFSIVAALVIGRLPSALAEARLTKPADFRSYPMNTPRFVYEASGKE